MEAVLGNLAEMLGQAWAGKMRPLAQTTPKRLARRPQVSTVAESACPGVEDSAWLGVTLPAHTPAAMVATVAEGVQSARGDASLRQQLIKYRPQPS